MAYTFLTIEGVPVSILVGSGAEEVSETQGKQRRSFAGTMLSSERTAKLNFSGQADFWSATDLNAMLAAISLDLIGGVPKPVTVSSDADGLTRGMTITAYVRAGKREAMVQTVGGLESTFWTCPLTIREA